MDAFSTAISKAENVGATVTTFVANATTVLALSKLKKLSSGSNEPLLQPDPTLPTRRQILGVPLYSVPGHRCTHQHRVGHRRQPHLRRAALDVDLVVDASRYFESDRLGIRATIRVAFGYPHEAAIVRIAPEPGT